MLQCWIVWTIVERINSHVEWLIGWIDGIIGRMSIGWPIKISCMTVRMISLNAKHLHLFRYSLLSPYLSGLSRMISHLKVFFNLI